MMINFKISDRYIHMTGEKRVAVQFSLKELKNNKKSI